ncbi:MAG: biopolymer transporter ExbD [Phycisphaerae bacterium]|nr:biopolymer transporter ExbD [Phycisphaerae bacterium]
MLIKAPSDETGAHIEITPMIDMVFLLLIFFLVATTFHQTEREMQVALPQASHAAPMSSLLRELVINVDEEGRIIITGRTVEPGELKSMIENAVAGNPEQKVTVRGDRRTAYANIVRVLDVCKGGGIREPYLDTVLVE